MSWLESEVLTSVFIIGMFFTFLLILKFYVVDPTRTEVKVW